MPTGPPTADHDEADLRVSEPKRSAAGVPGVVASLRHARAQLGPARAARTLLAVNQPQGFDCPGCAWPDPGPTAHLEFCENGAKAVAEEATLRRVTPEFFAEHPVSELALRTDHWLGQQGRLTHPMLRPAGEDHYRPVSWDEAFDVVAAELARTAHPDRAVFYTSGRTSNEAAFLYQLLVRRFGTNNLPDCSNMCHESSGVALTQTIGIGKGSVTLDDVHEAELVVVVGQNPGTNHPRMLAALEQAKAGGAVVVAINPLHEAGLQRFKNPKRPRGVIGSGTALADEYLQIKVGADLALFQYLNRRLVELDDERGDVLDRAFLAESCEGADELVAHLRTLDPDELLAATGLARADVERVAELLATRSRIVVCWAMGITQHRQAVPTIREIVNTLLLRGSIGRPGAGACPVRGHSNVQGDRTMGIYEKPAEGFLKPIDQRYQFHAPRAHGYDVVDCIGAMRDGHAKVFVALGGNFISATPDSEITAKAIMNCGLTVQISTKLSRSHVITGEEAIILPCLGRSERDMPHTLDGSEVDGGRPQFVTVEDSMSVVHRSQGSRPPASPHLRSEPWIVCGMAAAALPEHPTLRWHAWACDHDRIRDEIEAVIPGFSDFNKRVRTPDGFVLPNGARDGANFTTGNGKARFSVDPAPEWAVPQGSFLLMTIRTHDQFNTTVYGLDDHYRGIHGERRAVLMHADDMQALGLVERQRVDLVSSYDRERVATDFFVLPYGIARGCVATYFPEANVLVPLHLKAEKSGTPASKSVLVSLRKR
ncbi:MAG: FdhF/YdeP family oxidoreductase [Actinobacteria bacterium]|nr:FdhF/YdeP family oxidoreductase [Actinomycetota bacterium]